MLHMSNVHYGVPMLHLIQILLLWINHHCLSLYIVCDGYYVKYVDKIWNEHDVACYDQQIG